MSKCIRNVTQKSLYLANSLFASSGRTTQCVEITHSSSLSFLCIRSKSFLSLCVVKVNKVNNPLSLENNQLS